MQFLKNILATLALTSPILANAQSIEDVFMAEQAKSPQFALGLAYSSPGYRGVLTRGPIHKGTSDQLAQEPLWHIGSITKSVTATLVMQQVERGRLQLDAPIGTYLGDTLHPDWQNITLRQLMSHTAGLRRDPRVTQILGQVPGTPSQARRTVLESFWTSPPKSKPGLHTYSNLGYLLIGTILETVAGNSWEDLVLDDIAKPLGLNSLGFGAPIQAGSAWGHRNLIVTKSPVDPTGPKADNPAWLGPAGTVHMTIEDLLKWGEAHLAACAGLENDFLSQDSCQLMTSPVDQGYGFGWLVEADTNVVWHNGSNTMWYAQLMLHPDTNSVVAVTQNAVRGAEMNSFATSVLNALISKQD